MKSSCLLLFFSAIIAIQKGQACTTLVAGKRASKDGSLMCSHSNDGEGTTDFRLVKVPAQTFDENARRPIFASPGISFFFLNLKLSFLKFIPFKELCIFSKSSQFT